MEDLKSLSCKKFELQLEQEALSAEHTSTHNIINNLRVLYQDQGQLAEAEAMFGRALAGQEKALGVEHASTLSTVNDLVDLYKE
jgi:hypothetical protein